MTVKIMRDDITAQDLRVAAGSVKDGKVARRLLAIALVLDGASRKAASESCGIPPNITLLKLPPYAPELNPMENVWQYIRANKLAITVFDSYEDILGKCAEAWNFFANDPRRITSITDRDWIKVKS